MAAGGFKEFVAGEVLDQDDINDYLMQGVLVFAGTAARGSAIGTAVEGQFAFLKDTDTLTYYSGTAWEELASIPSAVVSATTGSPTLGTVTSGGDTFNVYSYTGDGSITFSSAGTVDVLVLSGGAGGGSTGSTNNTGCGGGGAGGWVRLPNFFVGAGTATVTVGAGGAAATNGGQSVFAGLIVMPAGGAGTSAFGRNGASGGGEGIGSGNPMAIGLSVSPAIGNNGGEGFSGPLASQSGGGGGGQGAVGGNAASTVGGAGGAGVASDITGTSLFYAGGGGGGGRAGGGGAGGSSIGGAGGSNSAGVSASPANRGSGGGGAGGTSGLSGGNGSAGVVIVRVKI